MSLAGTDRSDLPPFVSPYTARESPPLSEQIIPGSTYRREDLVRELSDLFMHFGPHWSSCRTAGDQHPDHCATHLLVHEALVAAPSRNGLPPRLLHYILHYPDWPCRRNRCHRWRRPGGRAQEWTWSILPLTAVEADIKPRALNAYRSQMLVMPDFFKSFEGPNELFIEGDPPSPFPCWCNGDNISLLASGGQ